MHTSLFKRIEQRINQAGQYAKFDDISIGGTHHPADFFIVASELHGNVLAGSRYNLIPRMTLKNDELEAYVDAYIIGYDKSPVQVLVGFAEDVRTPLWRGNGFLVKVARDILNAQQAEERECNLPKLGEAEVDGLVLRIPVDSQSVYGAVTERVHVNFDTFEVHTDNGTMVNELPAECSLRDLLRYLEYFTSLSLVK